MSVGRLCILGAGPGGLRAAFEGLRLGFEVTLAERELVGGTCLNRGCIPTKHYLGGTAAVPLLRGAMAQKLATGSISPDLRNLKAKKDRFVKASRQAMEKQLSSAGVRLLFGTGRVSAPGQMEVAAGEGVQAYAWDALIIATGSHPSPLLNTAADHDCVLDSTDALELEEAPESLIVVGAGAIGLEMADFFGRLGAKISLVEGCAQLAPAEDPELGEALRRIYEREGWEVHTGRNVAALATRQGKAILRFADGGELSADKALLAVGRRPNSVGLSLEILGLEQQSGWLPVDECLRVTPGVYAIGDVNGKSLLAHAADHQARYAVAHAAGEASGPYAPPPVPACIYGHMEVMRVGPSVQELRDRQGIECSRGNMVANPIAQAYCATQGFIKVFWEEGRVCAISALGHGVSHLVGIAGVVVSQGWRVEDIHRIIWAHPTLDEALEAALSAPREAL
jgi:dihydrolipoamide dehydrogenase